MTTFQMPTPRNTRPLKASMSMPVAIPLELPPTVTPRLFFVPLLAMRTTKPTM